MPTEPNPNPAAGDAGAETPGQKAERPADEPIEALRPGATGTEQPPATEPAAEAEKPVEVNWEKVLQRAGSTAAAQKPLPALPEGITVESAPEHLRAALVGFGYKPAVEEKAAPAEPAGPSPEFLALTSLQANAEYQDELDAALSEAGTREERMAGRQKVNEAWADRYLDDALELLEDLGYQVAGLEGTELDNALKAVPGLVLPVDANNPAQTLAMLMSARRLIRTGRSDGKRAGGADVQSAVAAREAEINAYLEREAATQRIAGGGIQSAAGAPGGGGTDLRTISGLTKALNSGRITEAEFREQWNKITQGV